MGSTLIQIFASRGASSFLEQFTLSAKGGKIVELPPLQVSPSFILLLRVV